MKFIKLIKFIPVYLVSALPIQASSYSFGNAIFSSNSYNSDGSELEEGSDTASIFFELGVFQEAGVEFTPTFGNITEWGDHFISLDSIDYDPSNAGGYFTGGGSFGDSTGQVDNIQAPVGYRVYLWGYETKVVPTTGSDPVDWFLITGDAVGENDWSNEEWVVPDITTTNQSDLERQWTIATANTAIVGSIMGSTGEGEIEVEQTLGGNDIQFAAIPEPSSLMFVLLASLTFFVRRRHS